MNDEMVKLKEENREMIKVLRELYRDTHMKERLKEYEVRALISPHLKPDKEV